MSQITIREVAEHAGVSEATVSRVLNNKKWVKEETREKVLHTIAELRYQPDGMAQKLGSGRGEKGIIGVLIANSSNSLYDDHTFFEIVRGVGDIVEERDKSLLLHCLKKEHPQKIPKSMTKSMVDGLIIGGTSITKSYARLLMSQGIPVVVIGNQPWATHRILVDNYAGSKKAVDHLLDIGHDKIGCISGSVEIYSYHDKVEGYKSALKERGIQIDPNLIVEEPGEGRQGGYAGMKQLMELSHPPTAIFCTDFEMTMGGWLYLSEAGIQVPSQLSLVSYCSGDLGQLAEIPLTTIRIGERNIGHAAARLLLDVLDERISGSMDISISTELMLGMSTQQLDIRKEAVK